MIDWRSSRTGTCPGRPWHCPGTSQVKCSCAERKVFEFVACRGTKVVGFYRHAIKIIRFEYDRDRGMIW